MTQLKQIAVALVIVSAILVSGCSKYKIFTMAIDSGRNKADLTVKKTTISIGDIVYLDNLTESDETQAKDVILMIHGFGADKDNWLRLSDEMTDDYRIVALDLPGHGESVSDLTNNYTIENQAKWVNEFMEALTIDKAHVIGSSMGGAISIKLTHTRPDKVTSLTLLDSAGVYKTESEFAQLLKQGINPLVVTNPDEFERMMDFAMEKKPYIPGAIIDVFTEKKIARNTIDKKIFDDIRTDMDTVKDLLPEIKAPTLIIWGDKDRILHVDNADEFHQRIRGSQKVVFEGIGHLPMIEAPKETGKHYARFLMSQ